MEINIQSDREVTFGKVIEIMDISRKAGAKDISFIVEKKIETQNLKNMM